MNPIVTYAGIHVELSDAEIDDCREWAREFMRSSAVQGLNHATTYRRTADERLEEETIGFCAHLVFCKWQGIPFAPKINTFHSLPDVVHEILGVGRYHEIRGTKHPNGGLPIRDNDDDEYLGEPRIYTLVTGSWPVRMMTIRGWARAADAKRNCYRWNPHSRRLAWRVPQYALNKYPEMAAAEQRDGPSGICPLCWDVHGVCTFAAWSLYCVTVDCANPHHRPDTGWRATEAFAS